jgi:hypothetical protein
MRFIAIAAVVLLALASSVLGVSTSNTPEPKAGGIHPVGSPDGRVGGETMADAFLIPSFPFSDTASTVGHVNDYDEACPFGESLSPDVVYKFVPPHDLWVTVDLCSSQYDTKVYIYQDVLFNVVACNDDANCGFTGYQSKIDHAYMPAGHTYYIIVDGYGGEAGTYVVNVTAVPECVLGCPPGALVEEEPWCHDDYVDESNSGCGHDPMLFEDIAPGPSGQMITLCGTSGTYLYSGLSYRDTDWFQLALAETQTITVCCTAEFPLLLMLIYDADCADIQFDYATAGVCEQACLVRTCGPGLVWLWVGPSVFEGVPCGSDYIMTISGYATSTPAEGRSWGAVKALYR